MREDDLKPLDAVFETLQPAGTQERVRWLFRPGAATLGPNVDWNLEQADLAKKQVEAASQLLAELPEEDLFAFASTVTMRHALGIGIANADVQSELKHALMKRGISAAEPAEADVGLGIFQGLMTQAGTDGASWTRRLWQQAIAEGWGRKPRSESFEDFP